ncbi:hypothetical protein [Bacillus sp. ES1-5]|uniref:hypothetical protein n=1 Tax=Bacillus sp. ES1-5 TaxID=1502999 RepID=UPI001F0C6916|nr:hypothetical protein [Bacillus sp. ES1-5]
MKSIVDLVSDPRFVVGVLSLGGVIFTVVKTAQNVNNTNNLKKELEEQTNKLKKELADQTNKITKELGEKNLKALEQRRYIDTISTERVKWINTMRDRFSECVKLIYTQMTEFSRWKKRGFDNSDESVREELRNRAIELTYVNNQIVLLLNTTEPISAKITILQNKILNHLKSKDNIPDFEYKNWSVLTQDLVYLHQVVLKAEWKRVKKENKKGEEISDEEMNYIYTEVAKKLNNKRYNKYFGQSES